MVLHRVNLHSATWWVGPRSQGGATGAGLWESRLRLPSPMLVVARPMTKWADLPTSPEASQVTMGSVHHRDQKE